MDNQVICVKHRPRYTVVNMNTMSVTRYNIPRPIKLPTGVVMAVTRLPYVISADRANSDTDYLMVDTLNTKYSDELIKRIYKYYKYNYTVYDVFNSKIVSQHDGVKEIISTYNLNNCTQCIESVRMSLRVIGLTLLTPSIRNKNLLYKATNIIEGTVIDGITLKELSNRIGSNTGSLREHAMDGVYSGIPIKNWLLEPCSVNRGMVDELIYGGEYDR